MSVSTGRARLLEASEELSAQWRTVKLSWDDSARRRFERDVMQPLEPTLKGALSAMERMSEVLARVKRDCE